ncbi:MAG: glycosyltransferase family 9 protein, partial [Oxalobacteraceae bacterium]
AVLRPARLVLLAAQRLVLNRPPYIHRFNGVGSWVYHEATDFAVAQGFASGPIVPKMALPPSSVEEAWIQMEDLPRPRFAFAIGSSSPEKNWGGEKFLQLAKILVDLGCGVLVLGGPAEREATEKLFASAKFPVNAVRVMCQSSVLKSAAALKTADFCIGNDTGILNVAVACDVPALGLFGNTRPLTHDPLLHAIHGQCMAEISVEAVVHRLIELHAPGLSPCAAVNCQ